VRRCYTIRGRLDHFIFWGNWNLFDRLGYLLEFGISQLSEVHSHISLSQIHRVGGEI